MGERKRQREKKSKQSEAEPANKSVKVEQPPAHIKEVDVGPKKEIAKHIKKQEKRLIVVLESANLETVKVIKFDCMHLLHAVFFTRNKVKREPVLFLIFLKT